jgi:hypothetical protein
MQSPLPSIPIDVRLADEISRSIGNRGIGWPAPSTDGSLAIW